MMKKININSLRTKLILILLMVSLASIIVVGLLSFFNARNSLQKAAMEALEANGNLKSQIIELFFQERNNDIKAAQDFFNIKTNLSVVSKYKEDRTNPEYHDAVKMLDGQLQTFQKVYKYIDITLVDPEGEIVYVSEKSHEKYDLDTKLSTQDSKAFEEGKKEVYFSDVFVNTKISNDLRMLVSAPAYNLDGEFIGVIAFEINMEPIYELTQDWTGMGETGETLIGKKIDNEFVFLNPFRHDSEYNLNQRIGLAVDVIIPMQRAVNESPGTGLLVDYRGEKVIAHWRNINLVNWGLVAKIDQKEAFSSVRTLKNYIVGFSIAFIIILIIIAFWISKKMVGPLNSLNKFSVRVASGEYDNHPKVTSNDEIGQLTVAFINMANQLDTSIKKFKAEIKERKQAVQELSKYQEDLEKLVKERTAELSYSNAELAKAARMKDEFLASMSHELRTPLNSVLGLSEALQEEVYGSLNQKQLKSLENIEQSGRHLLSLINEILDLAKIEAGKIELEYTRISIRNLVESSLVFVKQIALEKRLKVTSGVSGSIEFFMADEKRMKQILVNLLSNAVKFTPVGGEVALDVVVHEEDNKIDFCVKDTGIGISEENMEKLFIAFVQIDSSLSREYEGTGLGLALVKNLTELHNGAISVESVVNEGSSFTVSLPFLQEGEPAGGMKESDSNLFKNVRKAFIIEDNEVEAEQIRRYLKEINIESMVHYQGVGALEKVKEFKPDIVLLDIGLPDISGWEVLRALKADGEISAVPVVIVSVLDEKKTGFDLGAQEYIVKPITRKGLINVLEENQKVEQHTQSTTRVHGSQALILLADDNETNIETVKDYLEVKQFRVIVARNGKEAVARASEIKPELILMDIQMPEMDGLEATKEIRASKDIEISGIPIIALTALAMPGDEKRCLDAGADKYLKKPVGLKNLVLTINQFLGK